VLARTLDDQAVSHSAPFTGPLPAPVSAPQSGRTHYGLHARCPLRQTSHRVSQRCRRSTALRARRASSVGSIVDRSSSPDEGAADGQRRQNPTDQPADAGRTPCHVDSGRRFRCCDRGGGGGVGDDGPLVGLRPIRRQLRKCHDREFDGQRSRARMWCRSTRLVSRCGRPARRPLRSSSGSVSNCADSAIADSAGTSARTVDHSTIGEAVDPTFPLKCYGCWLSPSTEALARQAEIKN